MTHVLVAVTLPRHIPSSNLYRSPSEDAALSIALDSGASVEVVHVSEVADRDDLRVFGGRGAELTVIRASNPVEALSLHARETGAQAIFTGDFSIAGLGTGLLPYSVARHLDWDLFADVRGTERIEGRWRCTTALSHGKRAIWSADRTIVSTVTSNAASPKLGRYSEARKQAVRELEYQTGPSEPLNLVDEKRRPSALSGPMFEDYCDRLRSLISDGGGSSAAAEMIDADPDELARHLLARLADLGLTKAT